MRCFLYITGVHGLHAHASLDACAADRYGVHVLFSRIATIVEIAVVAPAVVPTETWAEHRWGPGCLWFLEGREFSPAN